MTSELLERLYAEQMIGDFGSTVNTDPKGNDASFLEVCPVFVKLTL